MGNFTDHLLYFILISFFFQILELRPGRAFPFLRKRFQVFVNLRAKPSSLARDIKIITDFHGAIIAINCAPRPRKLRPTRDILRRSLSAVPRLPSLSLFFLFPFPLFFASVRIDPIDGSGVRDLERGGTLERQQRGPNYGIIKFNLALKYCLLIRIAPAVHVPDA